MRTKIETTHDHECDYCGGHFPVGDDECLNGCARDGYCPDCEPYLRD